jgi:hypothetical protein
MRIEVEMISMLLMTRPLSPNAGTATEIFVPARAPANDSASPPVAPTRGTSSRLVDVYWLTG